MIRHWIYNHVRHEESFVTSDLQKCALNHSLYALPGPQCSHHDQKPSVMEQPQELVDTCEERRHFNVLLDVVQFRPENIIIQVLDGWLIIKGEHGSRMDEHGFISRSFTRTL
ncbi:hypothetical protein GDO86_002418 [Hymenochirus boettgeri]|uniref:SHSP domain-containing protein n=1 Tax=Hymenochirus boettgeri TaxID=247094 RepID=A0A8T2KMH6_9PIPI|nr:hypothetical protein GDO86_002418 [Hymenochirus boettgeri]